MSRRLGFRILQGLLVAAILAGGGFIFLRSRQIERTPTADVMRSVRVVQPERRDMEELLSLRAFIQADETVTILPLVSGTILNLTVDVGDSVETGQQIARIDPARHDLARIQAEASFSAAESTYQRTRRLFEADATTRQNYDQARAQFEATRSQLDLALLQLSYTEVRSPIAGVVLQRHLASGDIASPERPLVTVGDIGRLVVRGAVPEEWYRRFTGSGGGAGAGSGGGSSASGAGGGSGERGGAAQGGAVAAPVAAPVLSPVAVRIAAGGELYQGRIRTVAPYVSPRTRTFEVVSLVEGSPAALRPGMSVTVHFIFETRFDAPTLPLEALGYGNTLWYVDEGIARSLAAESLFSDGARMQIREEDAHHRYIVEGHHFLSDGQRVRVLGEQE